MYPQYTMSPMSLHMHSCSVDAYKRWELLHSNHIGGVTLIAASYSSRVPLGVRSWRWYALDPSCDMHCLMSRPYVAAMASISWAKYPEWPWIVINGSFSSVPSASSRSSSSVQWNPASLAILVFCIWVVASSSRNWYRAFLSFLAPSHSSCSPQLFVLPPIFRIFVALHKVSCQNLCVCSHLSQGATAFLSGCIRTYCRCGKPALAGHKTLTVLRIRL